MATVLRTYDPVDPQSDLDYSINWAQWLPTGDTIATSDWAIDPVGPTLNTPTVDVDGKVTTVWVDGPLEVGVKYTLTNHIITAEGREDDRSVALKIKDR